MVIILVFSEKFICKTPQTGFPPIPYSKHSHQNLGKRQKVDIPKPKWFGTFTTPKPAKVGEFGILTHPKTLRHEHKIDQRPPNTLH